MAVYSVYRDPLLELRRGFLASDAGPGCFGTSINLDGEPPGTPVHRVCIILASPDFMAGAIEGGVAKTKVPVTVQIENRRADGFDILVTES